MSKLQSVRSKLYGSGIAVVGPEEDSRPGVTVVVGGDDEPLRVLYKHEWAGNIVQTEGQSGVLLWQSQEIEAIASKDLDRVVFRIVGLRPAPETPKDNTDE